MAEDIFRFLRDMGIDHLDNGFSLEAGFIFPVEFFGFQGHFPGAPVLPAMIQLLVVRLLVERAIGEPVLTFSVDRTKFKCFVRPEELVIFQVDGQESGQNSWSVRFKISRVGKTVATGGLTLTQVPG